MPPTQILRRFNVVTAHQRRFSKKANMSDGQSAQDPGLVGGHVQYAKGAVETAIGDVTGSESWKASGQQDKEAGVAAMRKADEKRDPAQGYGKVEEVAGKWTGCEGMKKEGAESSRQKND